MKTDVRYREVERIEKALKKHKVKCKCGHTILLVYCEKVICSWCGNYVYKNKKIEFRERMQKCLKKSKKEDM